MTRRPRRPNPVYPTLADQCELYLAGRVAEQAVADHRPVPAWAWINLVAHASEAELRRLADDGEPLPHCATDWRWWVAVDRIAHAVLSESARSGRTIESLQRNVLDGVESALIGLPADASPAATQVSAMALAALYGHPCWPH